MLPELETDGSRCICLTLTTFLALGVNKTRILTLPHLYSNILSKDWHVIP